MVKTGDPNPHDFIYPSFYYFFDRAWLLAILLGRSRIRHVH